MMNLPQTIVDLAGQSLEGRKPPMLLAVCGWADTGKSTLAKHLDTAFAQVGIDSDSMSTDGFMKDRSERYKLGLSGYNPLSMDIDALNSALAHWMERKPFAYFGYDNKTGTKQRQPRTIRPSSVLVVEGIHAFHAKVVDQFHLKVFIDADQATLRAMRYRANMLKRGMNAEDAASRIDDEWKDYQAFIGPQIPRADLIVRVNQHYEYEK
jgi:uridine kinase